MSAKTVRPIIPAKIDPRVIARTIIALVFELTLFLVVFRVRTETKA